MLDITTGISRKGTAALVNCRSIILLYQCLCECFGITSYAFKSFNYFGQMFKSDYLRTKYYNYLDEFALRVILLIQLPLLMLKLFYMFVTFDDGIKLKKLNKRKISNCGIIVDIQKY